MLYLEKRFMIIMQGLPGSGKSTHAENLARYCGFQLIQPDCIRYALGVKHNGEGWTPTIEDAVKETVRNQRVGIMYTGLPLVIDETHTKEGKVSFLLKMCRMFKYTPTIERLDTDMDVCIQRRKPTGFPVHVIERMDQQLKEFDEKWPVIQQQYPEVTMKSYKVYS